MESSLTFLIVVLSIFLALFLLLSIILLVKAIQLVNTFRGIAEHLQAITEKVDSLADVAQKASGSIAVGRLITKIVEHVHGKKDSKEDKE